MGWDEDMEAARAVVRRVDLTIELVAAIVQIWTEASAETRTAVTQILPGLAAELDELVEARSTWPEP